MSEFNRHYAVLSLFTICALGCVIYSSRGGDPSFGSFGSGLAAGILIAFFFMRRAELALSKGTAGTLDKKSIESAEPRARVNESEPAALPSTLTLETMRSPRNNDTRTMEPISSARSTVEQDHPTIKRCSCVCGCSRRSVADETELCGNCNRWWMQQSERCSCDFSVQEYCDCGAINHGVAV